MLTVSADCFSSEYLYVLENNKRQHGTQSRYFLPLPSPLSQHTYLLSFHYSPSFLFLPSLHCICSAASLSPYQKVTEWFRSTAQSPSAKGHEQLFPFLESTCHSLISFNSVIPSFAGGGSGVGRRQHSLMLLSLLQRILLSPSLSVRVPHLEISHTDHKRLYVTHTRLFGDIYNVDEMDLCTAQNEQMCVGPCMR